MKKPWINYTSMKFLKLFQLFASWGAFISAGTQRYTKEDLCIYKINLYLSYINSMKKAAIYLRVSTTDQNNDRQDVELG